MPEFLRDNLHNTSNDIDYVQIKLASPDDILNWSRGEVLEPETINYRTQKPEKGGLFCESIFGPVKDYKCSCGKYRGIRYKDIVCDRCGVTITRSDVRRTWMGHINLCIPICHIWYLKTPPYVLELLLDMPSSGLEQIIYYNAFVITDVNQEKKDEFQKQIELAYKAKLKNATTEEKSEIVQNYKQSLLELKLLRVRQILNEKDYFSLIKKYSDVFEADTGSEPILRFLEKIDLKKEQKEIEEKNKKGNTSQLPRNLKRLKIIKAFIKSGVKAEWIFVKNLPILPPDLRPMVPLDGGRYASSDLNDLYRRIITRNNRLKKLIDTNAPLVIVKNEKRMLQEAVDSLFDSNLRKTKAIQKSQKRPYRSLADVLKGKQGRFRQNLLGKRVDYSGRSVIVVGPQLKMSECGLPKNIALELFRPFIIHQLLSKEIAYSTATANRLIDDKTDEVWAILDEVIQNKYVLLNRAPTLHRLSIQAFQPVLTEGLAIKIHPLVCTPFNADFDGDQMSVHLPLSKEAQQECGDRMSATKNLLVPTNGEISMRPTKDIILGCYWLTVQFENKLGENKKFANDTEALLAFENKKIDLQAKIFVKFLKNNESIETTVGRIIFNNILPADFPYQNKAINDSEMRKIVNKLIYDYGFEISTNVLDSIKDVGFKYSGLSGISWGIYDLIEPKEKFTILEKGLAKNKLIYEQYNEGLLSDLEKKQKLLELWEDIKKEISQAVQANFTPESPVTICITSKARGSWDLANQMLGIKGLIYNASGEIIEAPILSSYKSGYSPLDYFNVTPGARKGLVDTALRTSSAGYLTRRLVDVSQDVVVLNSDCGDEKGIEINRLTGEELVQPFSKRIAGRVLAKEVILNDGTKIKKNTLLSRILADQIEKDEKIDSVNVFSPLTCLNVSGICQKCYGADLANWNLIAKGEAVGIIAAQSIGEPGTQLTLKSFHSGGVAGAADITTTGLPYIELLIECRNPKNEAIISEISGTVLDVISNPNEEIQLKIVIDDKIKNPQYKKGNRKSKVAQVLQSGETFTYLIPVGKNILVNKGDKVVCGQILTSGTANLKKLFRLAGIKATQDYIKKECGRVYQLAGSEIHDKHFEIIIKKMFSQLLIVNSGDSEFITGEISTIRRFIEANYKLLKNNKTPAKAVSILRGITRVALNSDSFLSAASFQETSQILVKSSIEARIDKLESLKANIIISRLIPAGTGFRYFKSE